MDYDEKLKRLNLCGCVDYVLVDDLISILKCCASSDFYITEIVNFTGFQYKYVLLILCWLDELEFIEHGSAIRGSWATDKGKSFLEEL